MEVVDKILRGQYVPWSKVDANISEKFTPLVKENITYIVCAVVINDKNEVLLMQEAKKSCYGTWYLPAGRLEKQETFIQGTAREVKEETGLDFSPLGLVSLEFQSGIWYRFTFYGTVTGGQLKTTEQKDKESLQASFFPLDHILCRERKVQLRSTDIVPLIERVVEYKTTLPNLPFPPIMPIVKSYKQIFLRTVLVRQIDKQYQVLFGQDVDHPFPVSICSQKMFSLLTPALNIFQVVFGHNEVNYACHGVIGVEHCPKPAENNDGMCLTVLLSVKQKGSTHNLNSIGSYTWQAFPEGPVFELLLKKMSQHPVNALLKVS